MCELKRGGGWHRYRLCEPTADTIQFHLDKWGMAMALVAAEISATPWWQWTPDAEGTMAEYALRARVCGMIGHTLRGWHRFARTQRSIKRGRVTANS